MCCVEQIHVPFSTHAEVQHQKHMHTYCCFQQPNFMPLLEKQASQLVGFATRASELGQFRHEIR